MTKPIRIAIRIDNKLHEALKEKAEHLDISVGQYIRQVVKGHINEVNREPIQTT